MTVQAIRGKDVVKSDRLMIDGDYRYLKSVDVVGSDLVVVYYKGSKNEHIYVRPAFRMFQVSRYDRTPTGYGFTDDDGNEIELMQYPYNRGDRACVGCIYKLASSSACKSKKKTCKPLEGGHMSKPLYKGHMVYRHKGDVIEWS